MINRILYLVCLSVLLVPANGFAHPPKDIKLTYNLESQQLHVEMHHQTHDAREDYIRKLEVTKNSDEPIMKYYRIQLNTQMFEEDVKLSAQEGDRIKIKAYSIEGGTKEAEIMVSKTQEEEMEDSLESQEREDPRPAAVKSGGRY